MALKFKKMAHHTLYWPLLQPGARQTTAICVGLAEQRSLDIYCSWLVTVPNLKLRETGRTSTALRLFQIIASNLNPNPILHTYSAFYTFDQSPAFSVMYVYISGLHCCNG